MIVGISGLARAGKDSIGDVLHEDFGFVKMALADPMKRFCMDVYDWTEEHLWGDLKDVPDDRYVRVQPGDWGHKDWIGVDLSKVPKFQGTEFEKFTEGCLVPDPFEPIHLTPRYALQRLGTEWGRETCRDTWVLYALRIANKLLDGHGTYRRDVGLSKAMIPRITAPGICISDCRFFNEMNAVKEREGILIRVKRKGAGLKDGAELHESEQAQMAIDDDFFDHIIENDGTIEELQAKINEVFLRLLR